MITLKNVTLRRGTKVLLDGVSCTIHPGERVGLVGRNGAGKSTLFALLNGTLHEDGGDFDLPAQWRLAQVAQNMPETDQAATAFVLEGDTRLQTLQQDAVVQRGADGLYRVLTGPYPVREAALAAARAIGARSGLAASIALH